MTDTTQKTNAVPNTGHSTNGATDTDDLVHIHNHDQDPAPRNISREDLVAALHARGLCYLAPTPTGHETPTSDDELIVGLASSKDARLRFALAGLLLIHPELAERIVTIVAEANGHSALTEATRSEIKKQYVAATYLQRLWRTRLRLRFGDTPLVPLRFIDEMHLPSPDEMYGELGLRMLVDRSPYNDWSSYEQVVDLLCEQPCTSLPLPPGEGWGEG